MFGATGSTNVYDIAATLHGRRFARSPIWQLR